MGPCIFFILESISRSCLIVKSFFYQDKKCGFHLKIFLPEITLKDMIKVKSKVTTNQGENETPSTYCFLQLLFWRLGIFLV